MNAAAKYDLEEARSLAKTALGQFNMAVNPPSGLGNVSEALDKLCCVCLALAEENENLEAKLSDLEAKIQAAESTARHANNIASCLANGIQPD